MEHHPLLPGTSIACLCRGGSSGRSGSVGFRSRQVWLLRSPEKNRGLKIGAPVILKAAGALFPRGVSHPLGDGGLNTCLEKIAVSKASRGPGKCSEEGAGELLSCREPGSEEGRPPGEARVGRGTGAETPFPSVAAAASAWKRGVGERGRPWPLRGRQWRSRSASPGRRSSAHFLMPSLERGRGRTTGLPCPPWRPWAGGGLHADVSGRDKVWAGQMKL